MWKCHKCGKPVYFAERMQSLGYDWHPGCLRCEECGKRLNPGQHAEHKGIPYCHVPCYGALFGPQLFGHGTRVESHKSFGVAKIPQSAGITSGNVPNLPRDHLESKLKVYNRFYDNKSLEIRSREVNNRLVLEGILRVYWGVQGVIHLKEDDDQRTFVVRKRNSCRSSKAESLSDKENETNDSLEEQPQTKGTSEADGGMSTDISLSESMTFDSCSLQEYNELPNTPEDEIKSNTTTESSNIFSNQDALTTTTSCLSSTLPSKLDKLNKIERDEIDELLQVERHFNDKDKGYKTMPTKLSSTSSSDGSSSKTVSGTDSLSKSSDIFLPSPSTTNETISSSSDHFMTATENTKEGQETYTITTTFETLESSDDATLKPIDFEDFNRSVHQDYVSGANSFQQANDDTLKKNQPIDPSRINDSLKIYGENSAMSKSFNSEHGLRIFDPKNESGNDENSSSLPFYALQKSGSATTASSTHHHLNYQKHRLPYHRNQHEARQLFEKGINRSKSGPSCFDFSDSDDSDGDDSTLSPKRASKTIRRSNVPPRYIKIQMDCYPKEETNVESEGDSINQVDSSLSPTTNSASIAGDELTQTANRNERNYFDEEQQMHVTEDGVVLRRPPRSGAAAIKRRSGVRKSRTKLKRRCSINGHFYNRETSFFTPPYGSQMSVWVTSLVNTQEVINLILEKYKVDSPAENFSLFIMRDNGEQKRLKDTDFPLITRVMLGPHEDVSRLFLVDAKKTEEISSEVAQFLNLSIHECRSILERYDEELEREIDKVREKYEELRRRIAIRMDSLKVHL